MAEFIDTYWMQALWTVLIGIATWFIRKIAKLLVRQKEEQNAIKEEWDAIKNGLLSLEHDRIYAAFRHCFSRYKESGKGLTMEERRNLEYLFQGYEKLGGNGTGKKLYERCMALPVERENEDEI